MKLHDALNQPTFPRLKQGVHQVVVLGYKIKADKNGDDYLSISFAPSSELRNVQTTNIFPKKKDDDYDSITTLANNLQDCLDMPGAVLATLLQHLVESGEAIPATHNINITPDRTYFNWYLGYEQKKQPVADIPEAPVGPAF